MRSKGNNLDRIFITTAAALTAVILLINSIQENLSPRVLEISPNNVEASSSAWIRISFNTEMDSSNVEEYFIIQPDTEGEFTWSERSLTFKPALPLMEDTQYTISLPSGIRAASGRILKETVQISFHVRQSAILYLHPTDGPVQLWSIRAGPSQPEPVQLTAVEGSIRDYSAAVDGSVIAYVEEAPGGTDRIWLHTSSSGSSDLLVDCGNTSCLYPALSPDRQWLAYFRENGEPGNEPLGEGLWIAEVKTGITDLLVQTDPAGCDAPSWSPDGTMLAWADESVGGIRIRTVYTGEEQVLPSSMGISGNWVPGSQQYLFSELQMAGSQPLSAIYRADLLQRSIEPLFSVNQSGNSYRVPVCSPDGRWLAAGVQGTTAGPGYQLALYRCGDPEQELVTAEPEYSFSSAAWRPDSAAFLYQRIENLNPTAAPSVWLYDLENTSTILVSENAYRPGWLP